MIVLFTPLASDNIIFHPSLPTKDKKLEILHGTKGSVSPLTTKDTREALLQEMGRDPSQASTGSKDEPVIVPVGVMSFRSRD